MKKALFAMAAVGAIAAAAPASAQNADLYGGANFSNRLVQIDSRIEAGLRAGTITTSEARALREELREVRRLERRYSRNGLTREERFDLQARIRDLRQDVRVAASGRGYDQYGNRDVYDRDDDDWDNDDVYAERIDRNRDGWDDRDIDRDGRWDDDVYQGRGGPYEDPDDYRGECRSRGGLGGVIDNVLGRDEDCGATLRVGARATGNLGPVPASLRYRYRDGGGVYYRSDGRAVYQIDARTHVVLRVYDVD